MLMKRKGLVENKSDTWPVANDRKKSNPKGGTTEMLAKRDTSRGSGWQCGDCHGTRTSGVTARAWPELAEGMAVPLPRRDTLPRAVASDEWPVARNRQRAQAKMRGAPHAHDQPGRPHFPASVIDRIRWEDESNRRIRKWSQISKQSMSR